MILRTFLLKFIASISLWVFTLAPIFSNQIASRLKDQPEKEILSNGLTLIHQKDVSSAITVLQILIKGGKGTEPEEKGGLAYLTTRLAIEIPDRGKVQNLMNQASRIYMMCDYDYSHINITCLSEYMEEALKITSKIMLNPLFSGLRIERTKEQMLHKRKTQEDDPINVGHNAHLEKLFAKTGYGGSILGSEESLKAIKKKDIKNFYDNYFKAGGMVVAVISDMEKKTLNDILIKYLTEFPSGKLPESQQKTASIPEEKNFFIEKETKQFFISFAFPLPKITSKNFALSSIVENLLGKGVGSRLWALRYREKLAYNVNSRATQMKDGGILEVYLETDKEKKAVALESLKKVLNNLFENGIKEEELKVTKTNTKASFLRHNETKETRARNLASFEALGLGYEYLNKFSLEIDTIVLDEINAYIKDVLNPEKGVEVVIGPKEEIL